MTRRVMIVSHACALPQNQKLFAIAAAERDWEITLVLPSFWTNEYGDVMPAELFPGFDARLLHYPVFRNGSVPLHGYRVRAARVLKEYRPEILYCHNEPYAVSTIQWARAARHASVISFGYFSCQNLVKRYPLPFRIGERFVYRRSKFAFPITEAVDQVHRTKGYANASTILPLGFDADQYFRGQHLEVGGSDEGSLTRSTNETVSFAFIGRVVEEKGLVTLAAALGKIRDLDWSLTMVGSGPYQETVRAAFARHEVADRVHWRGFIPHAEVAKFYGEIDCLLLPSESRPNWTEQFGRVLVEAMACGVPVIGSDSGEIPNIIRQTGGGLVFQEANASDLAGKMVQMIADIDDRRSMAESGHRYVHRHYALHRLADRFADAIEASVENR